MTPTNPQTQIPSLDTKSLVPSTANMAKTPANLQALSGVLKQGGFFGEIKDIFGKVKPTAVINDTTKITTEGLEAQRFLKERTHLNIVKRKTQKALDTNFITASEKIGIPS